MSRRSRSRGFSLTELLVAMMVFVSVMSGVALLFSGVVRTVRQTYQTNNAFELVRASFTRMQEDLQGAFTAREWGGYYQFYGNQRGFVFVGLLENGKMGRVTYAIHPSPESRSFRTTLYEPWNAVRNRLEIQAQQYAITQGMTELASQAYADARILDFSAIYPNPEASGGYADDPVEFEVSVTTYALVRLEEPGRTDLKTFDLDPHQLFKTLDAPDGPITLRFPELDPQNPSADEAPNTDSYGANQRLYRELLRAVNPTALGALNTNADLRVNLQNALFDGKAVYAVSPAVIEQLIDAKRRELWVRMVAGDPGDSSFPTVWDNTGGNLNGLPGDVQAAAQKKILDHVLADRILEDALLIDESGFPFEIGAGAYFDVLMRPPFFSYSADADQFLPFFNDIENVPGYAALYWPDPSEDGLQAWDATLLNYLGTAQSASLPGSPLTPRLPAMVRPGIWIMMESPQPGLGDFRRWFTQDINVPSGAVRGLPSTMTPSPGRV